MRLLIFKLGDHRAKNSYYPKMNEMFALNWNVSGCKWKIKSSSYSKKNFCLKNAVPVSFSLHICGMIFPNWIVSWECYSAMRLCSRRLYNTNHNNFKIFFSFNEATLCGMSIGLSVCMLDIRSYLHFVQVIKSLFSRISELIKKKEFSNLFFYLYTTPRWI